MAGYFEKKKTFPNAITEELWIIARIYICYWIDWCNGILCSYRSTHPFRSVYVRERDGNEDISHTRNENVFIHSKRDPPPFPRLTSPCDVFRCKSRAKRERKTSFGGCEKAPPSAQPPPLMHWSWMESGSFNFRKFKCNCVEQLSEQRKNGQCPNCTVCTKVVRIHA